MRRNNTEANGIVTTSIPGLVVCSGGGVPQILELGLIPLWSLPEFFHSLRGVGRHRSPLVQIRAAVYSSGLRNFREVIP